MGLLFFWFITWIKTPDHHGTNPPVEPLFLRLEAGKHFKKSQNPNPWIQFGKSSVAIGLDYIYIYIPKVFLITRSERQAYKKFLKAGKWVGLGFFNFYVTGLFCQQRYLERPPWSLSGKMDHWKMPNAGPCKRENRTVSFLGPLWKVLILILRFFWKTDPGKA